MSSTGPTPPSGKTVTSRGLLHDPGWESGKFERERP